MSEESCTKQSKGLGLTGYLPDRHTFSNSITAYLFCTTGPLAILVAAGQAGGLSESDLSSWIFGGYGIAGLITLWICWRYRQPLVIAWTIPGALLLPPALSHLSFAEVIGAYWVTGIAIAILGWSGLIGRVMRAIPIPIVMGMVAGVFLPLGIQVITAFTDNALLAGATLFVFLFFTLLPALGRYIPPVLAAIIAGGITAWAIGAMAPLPETTQIFARPTLYIPSFSIQAMLELVIPLMVTVLGIQNAQGIAILKNAGYEAPVKTITTTTGWGSILLALTGSVPACLTGPVNGIIVSGGDPKKHWIGAMIVGMLMIVFALFAPLATAFALALPLSLIGLIGGLAMMRVLQTTFQTAFRGECPLGALVSFVVSVAGVPIFNIGAPFWGLVFAVITSWLLERDSLRRLIDPNIGQK